ncbi:MAG: cytochrome b/b6 domain-containing protein [Betaproteobacteria bacterium]|jgi:cytochrome b
MALRRSDRGTPIWDVPIRIFHWMLALLVAAQVVTASIGGNAMQVHAYGGYAILALVLFRVLWGFFGGTHALFRNFVRGPDAVMRYAKSLFRGPHVSHAGHNPLGGWSVLAMLASLLLQAGSGLFADDDVMMQGPLAKHVPGRVSEIATAIHDANAVVLLTLIATHVAAVLFYLLARKQNLIAPMLSGRKHPPAPGEAARYGKPWLAAVLFACSAALVYFLVTI